MAFYDDLMRAYTEYKAVKEQVVQAAKTIKRLERQVTVLNVALRIAQDDTLTDVARDLGIAPSHSLIQEAKRLVQIKQTTTEPNPKTKPTEGVEFTIRYYEGDRFLMAQQTKPKVGPSRVIPIDDDNRMLIPDDIEALGVRRFVEQFVEQKGLPFA